MYTWNYVTFNLLYNLLGSAFLKVTFNLSHTLLGSVYLRVTFNLFDTFLGSVYQGVIFNLSYTLLGSVYLGATSWSHLKHLHQIITVFDNVHEKITSFWLAENKCILL